MDCKGSFRNWNVIESLDSVEFDELNTALRERNNFVVYNTNWNFALRPLDSVSPRTALKMKLYYFTFSFSFCLPT